jgi:fatty-acyl-CoA synthase
MLSYACGPKRPLLEETIYSTFLQTVARYPNADALIVPFQNLHLKFHQLATAVEQVAGALQQLGLAPGDRFGVWATNCAEWIFLQIAAARNGLVLVNVNPSYRAAELAYVLRKSKMRALFLHERDRRSDYQSILAEAQATHAPDLQHVIYLGSESWDRFLSASRPAEHMAGRADDVTNMQYTSGTTGSPKGVLLTHRNIVNNGYLIAQSLQLSVKDRIVVPVPLYHCFGCVAGSMPMITMGSAVILPAPTFEPAATMAAIERERASVIYGVPTMFIAQLEHAEFQGRDFSTLRTGIMAGAPCPIEIFKRVVDEMSCPQLTIIYGQTETSPVITGSGVDASLEIRATTVGVAYPNTEVKLIDVAGDTVEIGEQGELCTRGYHVMRGYDDDPEATSRAIDRDGWLRTGDLATMGSDGTFRVTGRLKDMIIRGGENIYPREIEEFLYSHPKVADMQVIGVPDLRFGEEVMAWIKLKAGQSAAAEEIRDFCRGKIAHYKIPRYVKFVTDFPMTVTGKIQKYKMREVAVEELGLQDAAHVATA